MGNKVRQQACRNPRKNCGAMLAKYDERTGNVIYYGKVLKKGVQGETIGVCPKCKYEQSLDSWNPLYLEK